MRATRCFEARRIICFKKEVVVASWIGAELGVIMKWTECQRCAAAPPAHHFCGQQFFVFDTRRIRFHILTKCGDALVQLAKGDVCSVPAENFRLSSLHPTQLISIAQHKLPRLKRLFSGIGSRNAAAFDRRVTDPVAKSEWFSFSCQCMTVLTPDCLDSRHVAVSLARATESCFQSLLIGRDRDEHDMHV